MSSVRNRSQSHHSPQVNQRVLQHDLEGATKALTAFDGSNLQDQCCRPQFCNVHGGLNSAAFFSSCRNRPASYLHSPAFGADGTKDGDFNLLAGVLCLSVMDHFTSTKG